MENVFSVKKEHTAQLHVLTKGVVDDLKQGEVASRHTVHPKFHDHSLRNRSQE